MASWLICSAHAKVGAFYVAVAGFGSLSPTVSSPGSITPESPTSPRSPASPNTVILKRPTSSWVTIEKSNLDVQGDMRAKRFLQYSDLQLKTDISDILGALQFVTQLSGKKYFWKKSDVESERQVDRRQFVLGFIAQEVQRVLPELVEETSEGYLAVKYSEFVPILIEALKQQAREVDTWSSRVEAISAEFDTSHRILLDELRQLSTQLAIPRGSSSTSTTSTSHSDSDSDSGDEPNSTKPIPQSPRVVPRKAPEAVTAITTTPTSPPRVKRNGPKRHAKPVMLPSLDDEDSDGGDEAADEASESCPPEVIKSTPSAHKLQPDVSRLDPDRMSPFLGPASSNPTKSTQDSGPTLFERLRSFSNRLTRRKTSKPAPVVEAPPDVKAEVAQQSQKQPMTKLKKGLIGLSIATIILALIASALAIYFIVWAKPSPTTLPDLPPVQPTNWRERNIAVNSGLEEDPSLATVEARDIAYWEGDFIRTPYSLPKKRPVYDPDTWPLVSNASLYFDAGKWGARMTIAPRNATLNETGLYSARYAAQVINMTYLGLQITDGAVDPYTKQPDPTHYVCGMNVSVWFSWAYASPLNETNPNLLNSSYDWTNQTFPQLLLEVMTLKTASGYIYPSQRYNMTSQIVDLLNGNISTWDWHQLRLLIPIRFHQWPRFLAVRMSSTLIGSIFFDLVEARIVPCTFYDASQGIAYSSDIGKRSAETDERQIRGAAAAGGSTTAA